jgi:predicted transcriptional regulator
MNHNGTTSRPLAVGDEPPPLEAANRTSGKGSKAKRKAADRFAALNGFVDFALARLNRAEIAVWLILYRDTRDGTARTAYDDIARRAGCNRSTVYRAVHRLESAGLLRIVYRGGLGRGPSRYCVRPIPWEG